MNSPAVHSGKASHRRPNHCYQQLGNCYIVRHTETIWDHAALEVQVLSSLTSGRHVCSYGNVVCYGRLHPVNTPREEKMWICSPCHRDLYDLLQKVSQQGEIGQCSKPVASLGPSSFCWPQWLAQPPELRLQGRELKGDSLSQVFRARQFRVTSFITWSSEVGRLVRPAVSSIDRYWQGRSVNP